MDAKNHFDQKAKAEQHLNRAYAHEEAGAVESSLRECELAIRLAPDLAEAHNLRGILLEELGRGEEAITGYREAVRLDPAFQEARENLREAEAELWDKRAKAIPPAPLAMGMWVDPMCRLSIDTPENVVFDYEVAGIGSRFLAALVDTLLILLLQAIVGFTLALAAGVLVGDVADLEGEVLMWLFAVFGLISFAFLWGYYVLFEMIWNGQSPGKRWVGLRVIRTDGTPITFVESLIRNLVRLVDFLPAYYGIGVVTMFVNEQSRRLGDLAAGTLVVREHAAVTLKGLEATMSSSGYSGAVPPGGPDLPVERLTNQDIQMAEEFLRRRGQLSNPMAVAGRIAQALLERMDITPDQTGVEYAQDLILKVVQASRDRNDRLK